MRNPKFLVLALAITAAITGCDASKSGNTGASAEGGSASTGTYKIDQSKLPAMNSFKVTDLDKSIDACEDFAGYANRSFLAAMSTPT